MNEPKYEEAISPWWSGGGSSRLIVDALRREGATVSEAKALASRLAVRAASGNTYMTAEVVDEQLEMVRAVAAHQDGSTAQGRDDDERNIGSTAWRTRARVKFGAAWERFFPGEKQPRSAFGQDYSDEADERYGALIRSQREEIRELVGKKQRKRGWGGT